MATRSDKERAARQAQKKRYRARRIEAGLTYHTEKEKEARKKQKRRAKEQRLALGLPALTPEQQKKKTEQKRRARERKRELGIPVYTEEQKAKKRIQKQRYREKQKLARAAAKAERLKERETPEWKEAYRQKVRESALRHYNKYKEYYSVRNAIRNKKRRHLLKGLDEFDKFVLQEAHYLRMARDKTTGFEWHVDHIIPVKHGGTSKYNNLQVVPAIWNLRKQARHSERYFNNGI